MYCRRLAFWKPKETPIITVKYAYSNTDIHTYTLTQHKRTKGSTNDSRPTDRPTERQLNDCMHDDDQLHCRSTSPPYSQQACLLACTPECMLHSMSYKYARAITAINQFKWYFERVRTKNSAVIITIRNTQLIGQLKFTSNIV